MNKSEILLRLKKLFLSVCEQQEGNIDFSSKQLLIDNGINSLVTLELILKIEDEFNLEIDDEDLNSNLLNDINFLAEYIDEYIN